MVSMIWLATLFHSVLFPSGQRQSCADCELSDVFHSLHSFLKTQLCWARTASLVGNLPLIHDGCALLAESS
jgi:hypothetical protein